MSKRLRLHLSEDMEIRAKVSASVRGGGGAPPPVENRHPGWWFSRMAFVCLVGGDLVGGGR